MWLRSGATEAKGREKGGRYGLRDMQAESGRQEGAGAGSRFAVLL